MPKARTHPRGVVAGESPWVAPVVLKEGTQGPRVEGGGLPVLDLSGPTAGSPVAMNQGARHQHQVDSGSDRHSRRQQQGRRGDLLVLDLGGHNQQAAATVS
jgi:hypothetical protein